MSAEARIAIVGGGMVGASLALLLAAACEEWEVVVIEAFSLPEPDGKQPAALFQPSFDGRSTALSAGTVDILSRLGIWSEMARHTTPIKTVHVSDKGHLAGALLQSNDYDVAALGYVIENAWMGPVLLHRLRAQKNITCLAPATVESIQFQQAGALLQVRSAEEPESDPIPLACDLAVIADGADSTLRKRLGIDVDITDYQQTAIVTNVAFEKPHGGVAFERFTEQGPLALLPMGESEDGCSGALVWTHPTEVATDIMALNDADFLQQLQKQFGFRLGCFTRVSQRAHYPLSLMVAKEQIRSSMVLMGNAAHFLHPVAGQGFNLALRDCAMLAEQLIQARDRHLPLGSLPVLQAYIESQSWDQRLTIGFSDQVSRLFSSAKRSSMLLRSCGLLGLEALPAAKNFLAQQTMGLAGRRVNSIRASST